MNYRLTKKRQKREENQCLIEGWGDEKKKQKTRRIFDKLQRGSKWQASTISC